MDGAASHSRPIGLQSLHGISGIASSDIQPVQRDTKRPQTNVFQNDFARVDRHGSRFQADGGGFEFGVQSDKIFKDIPHGRQELMLRRRQSGMALQFVDQSQTAEPLFSTQTFPGQRKSSERIRTDGKLLQMSARLP